MENEWYDEHYINFDKVIISGRTVNDVEIEYELDELQKTSLEDFKIRQHAEYKRFMRGLLDL